MVSTRILRSNRNDPLLMRCKSHPTRFFIFIGDIEVGLLAGMRVFQRFRDDPIWNHGRGYANRRTCSSQLKGLWALVSARREAGLHGLDDRRRCANGPVNSSLISSLWRETPVLRNTDFSCERMV